MKLRLPLPFGIDLISPRKCFLWVRADGCTALIRLRAGLDFLEELLVVLPEPGLRESRFGF